MRRSPRGPTSSPPAFRDGLGRPSFFGGGGCHAKSREARQGDLAWQSKAPGRGGRAG